MKAYCPYCQKEHELNDTGEILLVKIITDNKTDKCYHVFKCDKTNKEINLLY